MTDGLGLTITRKGLEECVSAKTRGIELPLKWVSIGDVSYTPSKEQTTLVNERARAEFSQYVDIGFNQIKAAAKFSGPDEISIREIGFWLESGTLLGVISAPDTLLNYKAKNGHCIQPFTLDLSALPSDTVTIVVGVENLNILLDLEMMMSAASFIGSQVVQTKQAHIQMNLSEKLRLLEVDK